MKRITVLAALAVVCLLGSAGPAEARPYLGASFLTTDAEFDGAVDSFELDDSSFKIFGGFTLFKLLDIEASYRDLGTFEDATRVCPSGMTCMFRSELEVLDLSVRGTIPIGKFSIWGRAGYANISNEVTSDVIEDFDEDDWELTYGIGLGYLFGKRFQVRAEWEEYDVDANLNSLSLGAALIF